ncbi:MAG: acetylglutamate kinase [Proteobacteria bacterium]|nr:acetylglutamate kinase [Pseudomonadota bacterium]
MTPRKISDTKHLLRTAETLSEAVPFIKRFAGSNFVIKYGGAAMGDATLAAKFARDVVLLKQVGINPVVVHGGGPQIGQMLERLKIKSSFVDGLRITDRETVDIVEMVLSGSINKQIVSAINDAGGRAVGISGKDGGLIQAHKVERRQSLSDSNIEKVLDLGFVGQPDAIDAEVLDVFNESKIIPVVAPIGRGADGETYNINADTAAGAIASAIGARKLVMLTDVAGVLDADGNLVSEMTLSEARERLADGSVTGGMIPKLETCLEAIEHSVEAAHILDGRIPHVLLLEIFTVRGAGTKIVSA